jgi:II/X family phage/plasmid replication protein
MKKANDTGRNYSADEIEHANKILRLELSLKTHHWTKNANWRNTTADDLKNAHERFFGSMLGGAEMTTDADVFEKLKSACETERRAQAAYGCWLAIQSCGWDRAREMYPRPTWYRHLKSLHAIGLGDADISAGRVVSIRKRVVECRPVSTWAELMKAA